MKFESKYNNRHTQKMNLKCCLQTGGHFVWPQCINTLRPRQNGRYFADDIFECIFFNEKEWISIKIPLKVVPEGPINNILALVQIMAWRRPGDKPLSEPMMVRLPTHMCVIRPQWVKLLPMQWPPLLTHWDFDTMAAILQMTLTRQKPVFWFQFHWILYLWWFQLTISQ